MIRRDQQLAAYNSIESSFFSNVQILRIILILLKILGNLPQRSRA